MSQQPPPPPPPHGENPKSTYKDGIKYDVFVIPDTGSGFFYIPSLQPNLNSFVAGFACALALVVLGQSLAPAFRLWWNSFQGMGNMGVVLLLVAVGLGAWSLGRQHPDGPGGPSGGSSSASGEGATAGAGAGAQSAPPPPNGGQPPPHSPPPRTEMPGGTRPGANWGTPRSTPAGTAGTDNTTPKGAWEKAREETRKREEERKAKEAEEKRREEAARRLKELREKEAREREQREKEAREREAREKEQKAKKEEEQRNSRKGSTYAYSGVGEKTKPWPNGMPAAAAAAAGAAASPSRAGAGPSSPATPTKRPPPPTAKTYLGTDEETFSYRPYDKPKPARKKSFSEASETSWAPSQSTARTTPPPSARAAYSTKDPDKIVIRAVYAFVNQFSKTPASQLISGTGAVTDGLILRITTEGLFIDDDVRGVAQREWDVKAWTLKLVEVWCPQQSASVLASESSSSPGAGAGANGAKSGGGGNPFKAMGSARFRGGAASERGAPKTLTGDEADAYLAETLRVCKDNCRLGLTSAACAAASASASSTSSSASSSNVSSRDRTKTGEWAAAGLHLLRATIRDQDAKRYLFVIGEEESWKVAVGLQRLRRGTQVRALGVAGLSGLETKSTLEMLGWTSR